MTNTFDMMETAAGKLDRSFAIRLKPGTDLLLGLQEACERFGIQNGVIVSALGSLSEAYFCNPVELPETKAGYGYGDTDYLAGPLELTNATGIVCHEENGEINLHVHITMTDQNGDAYGGHLQPGCKVLMTLDAILADNSGIAMTRKFDSEMGVPLFAPKQK